MFQYIARTFTIWRLRHRIARRRRHLHDLSMEYFTMEGALLRDKIGQDESRLYAYTKERQR